MPAQFLPPPLACKFLLDEFGIKRKPATLAKQRVMGGNAPPYRKLGRSVFYAVSDLSDWATRALKTQHRTTSDRFSDNDVAASRMNLLTGKSEARNARADALLEGDA